MLLSPFSNAIIGYDIMILAKKYKKNSHFLKIKMTHFTLKSFPWTPNENFETAHYAKWNEKRKKVPLKSELVFGDIVNEIDLIV